LLEQTAIRPARRYYETSVIADELFVRISDDPHATRWIEAEIIRAGDWADLRAIGVATVKHVVSRKLIWKDVFGLRYELRIAIARITRKQENIP
jgi:hypothetical protein